jgi:hypothetical protein
VCPLTLGPLSCCGGSDCCTPSETCFQGKCQNCELCGGGTTCCNSLTETCDPVSNTCQPKCGNGPGCLPSQQCCSELSKCCDATSQFCGATDCVPTITCPPGETRLPDNSCCIPEFVCGSECCDGALETCNECTGHCEPLPPVAVTDHQGG